MVNRLSSYYIGDEDYNGSTYGHSRFNRRIQECSGRLAVLRRTSSTIFFANDVKTAEKQRAILLSAVGGPTYQLIRNLLAPEKPHNKTFAQIVEAVMRHHQPKPSVIVQRFNFHSRSRASGENVSTFVAELRKLSDCNFGETLNDMLRDRLVCGINDQRLQRRLLSEPELTFAKALELAQTAEAAERNTRKLEKAARALECMSCENLCKKGEELIARHCYVVVNTADKCRFKESDCHHCGKKRHLAKVCRSKQRGSKPLHQANTRKPQEAHDVDVTRIRTIRQTICLTSLGRRHRPR